MTGKEVYQKVGDYIDSRFQMGRDDWEDLNDIDRCEWDFIADLINGAVQIGDGE